jgi:hypothetical protein
VATARKKFRRKQRPVNKLFLPDYLTEVKMVAMRGLPDKEIAQVFGISYDLFKKWKKTYPSFKDALDKGRLHCDAEVVAALFKRATGKFSLKETKIIKYKDDYETLDVRVRYPPDTEAIKYWLNNRAREHWQQRSAVEQSGPGGKPIEITAHKGELIDAIVNLVKPKPDGDSSNTSESTRRAKSKRPKKAS